MREASVSGTQSIGRAIALLRAIALRPANGWRLADLATECGTDSGTARRILKRLVQERLIARRARDGKYLPGPLLFELGLAVSPLRRFQASCAAVLPEVSEQLASGAFAYLRDEDEFVCIAVHDPKPIKGLVLSVGTRRPLGASSGGFAIALALPEPERTQVLKRCQAVARHTGKRALTTYQNILARSRQFGAGVNVGDGLAGVTAVGVPLCTADGYPFAAIGVGNSTRGIGLAEIDRTLRVLNASARQIETDCADAITEIADMLTQDT
jgi:DNA-binding IclR family transcriptional regulator